MIGSRAAGPLVGFQPPATAHAPKQYTVQLPETDRAIPLITAAQAKSQSFLERTGSRPMHLSYDHCGVQSNPFIPPDELRIARVSPVIEANT